MLPEALRAIPRLSVDLQAQRSSDAAARI